MSNSYFRFKQFTIHQDKTAMKVGTDGVLLGVLTKPTFNPKRILDIGTGTGLIALMLAQRFEKSVIDAVEIDRDASEQALYNFRSSIFADRISVFCTDISDYTPNFKYDLIVSNPPYFNNSLKAPDAQRSIARHTDSLSFDKLAKSVARLLSDDGCFCVIIPFDTMPILIDIFNKNGLFVNYIIIISHNEKKQPKRAVISFLNVNIDSVLKSNLYIEKSPNVYSDEFKSLVEPFYL